MFSLWYAFLAYRELKLCFEERDGVTDEEGDKSKEAAATADEVPDNEEEETTQKTPGGEPGEGEAAEGEAAEGEAAKGETAEGEAAEGEAAEGEAVEGEAAEGEAAKGKEAKGKEAKGKAAKEKPAKGKASKEETSKGEAAEGEAAEAEKPEGEAAEAEKPEGEAAEEKPEGAAEEKPAKEKGKAKGKTSKSSTSEPAEGEKTEGNGAEAGGVEGEEEAKKGKDADKTRGSKNTELMDEGNASDAGAAEEGKDDGKKNSKAKLKATDIMVDAAVLDKLEAGFKKLKDSDSKSLLKKHLTPENFDKLKIVKTPSFGSTLLDVIQSGLENHDSGVGVYAPDAEAYNTFADLFDPIIEDYHGGFKKTDKHPPKDWGDVDTLGNLDPNGDYIISTRVRCGRSMQGYPFNPCLTEAQYKEMEDKVSSTLSGLSDELKGQFYPLTGMTKEVQQKLIDDHFLFKEGDRFLQAANACRFWPTGRGIYHNDAKTFLIWCNEEDHLRIISMQPGGDLGQVYRRLVTAVNDIEKRIPFSHDDRLGFLTFCPTNLGTTVRASVHIKVPKLAANRAKLEEVAGKYNLQVRGTRGEHTEAEGGVYDISNRRRMGLTEYQAVKEMNDGIAELIKIESSL